MMRPRQIAVLSAALELMPGCGRDDVATSGFASGPHPITSPAGSSGSSGSGASTSSSGSTSGEDSGSGAVSASGTTTGSMSTLDMGPVPDFGGQPIGCQGKIDFLFVISSWFSMKGHQVQLQEAFPAFTAMLEDEFADFDYHIMVVEAGGNALLNKCDACYDCTGCMLPGCAEYDGPEDYPCKGPFVVCDVTSGAGVTITGNFGATNKRCDLFGDKRYIVKGEPNTEAMFKCIATLGEGPKTAVPMTAMQDALTPDMLSGGCNDGFLRKDALLAVVVLNGEQDNLTPGTPQDWYDAVVAAKGGNEEAIVTLVLSNDREFPDSVCTHDPMTGPNPLRMFAEAAAHGHFESICLESYVPALKKTAATILEQCSLLIPG
jgi:hypothetical protein